ncbi:DUF2142 domain-containing protein [Hungatella hathewayi]|uniref:Uncharacterized protein n=1 Tax=Hungatella hathewayi WAL-18680 TaxID=742737 RepID=G5IAE2_9FIRM|nr:DUF2142 domain-containing protein [Hungatella hathewayi]EHI61499.1 hypothetical protein HMPREF9473_00522 [ [Hungatella hathewayi WAL-18680]
MKTNSLKNLGKQNKVTVAGLLLLVFLGVKHYMDTRAGAIGSGDSWLTGQYMVLFVVCLLGALLFGYLLYGGWKLEHVFVAAGLFFGGLFLCVLPPLSAPDEVSHYISAYQLSSHIMGKPANYKTGHVLVRAEDWFLEDVNGEYQYELDGDALVAVHQEETDATVLGQTLTEDTYKKIHELGLFHHAAVPGVEGADQTPVYAVSTYPPVVTTPLAYVPQAVGITLARLLGMNSLGLAYLGRLFNLFFYVGITFFGDETPAFWERGAVWRGASAHDPAFDRFHVL